jgi:TonB family protein
MLNTSGWRAALLLTCCAQSTFFVSIATAETAPRPSRPTASQGQPAAHFGGLIITAQQKPRNDSKPPVVGVQETTVGPAGPITEELVRRMFIRQSLDALRGCYQRALHDAADLAGAVVVRFVIAPSGQVDGAEATTSLTPALDSCVVAEVKKVSFPRPGGGAMIITYPFAFKP